MPPKKWMIAAPEADCLGHALAEEHVGEQQAQAGGRVGLEEEEDRLAGLLGLVGAERGQDAVVDGVVEEEDLRRFDDDRGQRQDVVADQEVDHVLELAGDPLHDRAHDEEAEDGQDHAPDPGGEVVDQHLEAGLDLAVPEAVDLLHRPAAERAHDHGAHEHRDVGAGDDTHGRDGADDAAAHLVEVATGVADEDREQVGDHRADDAAAVELTPAAQAGDPAVVGGSDAHEGQPADLDEEGGDETPGDEGADVGHDHVRQEGAEPLDVDACGCALRVGLCGGGRHCPVLSPVTHFTVKSANTFISVRVCWGQWVGSTNSRTTLAKSPRNRAGSLVLSHTNQH
jgi:hypothetical protein